MLMNVEVQTAEQVAEAVPAAPQLSDVTYQHANFDSNAALSGEDPEALALAAQEPPAAAQDTTGGGTMRRDVPKVGRNDPCPCGSGKKYKACHGKL